jgi:uncharacterized protein YbjT (DUF2867 family)
VKVLVTGGTGYLGRAIVGELARRGHEPTVFARGAERLKELPGPAIAGDVRDHRALRLAVRGMDAVVHAAPLVSVWRRDPAEFDRINVGGLETLLDVCALEQIGRIVVTSSFLALPPAGETRALEANESQRSKVRAPARDNRSRSPVVLLGERGRTSIARARRARGEYVAGGENLPQMRAFELLRAARGTPLPRRIPGALAQVLAALEGRGCRPFAAPG